MGVKMRIAAYVDNKNIPLDDLSIVQKGNPGIGGTEYMFLILLYNLSLNERFEVFLYSTKYIKSSNLTNIVVTNLIDALYDSDKNSVDYFILRNGANHPFFSFNNRLDNGTKYIMWSHNYLEYDEATSIANDERIIANVFVSKQMYDRYVDHDIINKSTYIYNFINTEQDYYVPSEKKKNIVMFNGAIVPGKGFHLLAEVWPKVVKKIPDAKLVVMGSGKLYNRDAKMGNLGIAEYDYENKLIKLLGESIDSVEFLGTISDNKNDIIKNSKIGVVNPTGSTETFCISAVDFENCSVPVITKKKNGLLDVVTTDTGILIRNKKELYTGIIALLENDELCDRKGRLGKQRAKELFGIETNVKKWIQLLEELDNNKALDYITPNNYYYNNHKWVKIVLRRLRSTFHLSNMCSSLYLRKCILRLLKRQ